LRHGSPRAISRFTGVILCVLLGAATGAWHNRRDAAGKSDIVTSSVRVATVPLVQMSTGITRWFGRQIGWLFHGRTEDAENNRLRQENDRLRQENARLREMEAEAGRLRAQAGFPIQPPERKIAADVISIRPVTGFETMVINRGGRSGIRVHSVVVCPHGLVGQVSDVAPTSSVVQLLTEADSAAGARVQRPESRAVGICKGDGTAFLNMAYLNPDADVKVGDTIVSSGLGGELGVYPKGVEVGKVISVLNDGSASSKLVKVRPAVDFSRLEEVYVLR
jgi:rod shape-determining protein MreC